MEKETNATEHKARRASRRGATAVAAAALLAATAALASRTAKIPVIFMCRHADAVAAGWDASELATNALGLVVVAGYCHAEAADGGADGGTNRSSAVSSAVVCDSTNIVWNAGTRRLELDGLYFTKE